MEQIDTTTYRTTHDSIDLIVGDEKQKDFFPRVKVKRWGNEVNFSVGLKHKGGKHKKQGEEIVYDAGDHKAHFYPTKVESDILGESEKGGFEFSITLDKKPASNVIPLTITTKGLTFHYQPPLTKKESKTSTRPENVVGSYAVYHESKRDGEYKTGKAFHIFRPWAEDAKGRRVWCDIHIPTDKKGRATKDEITLTVPRKFLDSATYPVLIDPTVGYTSAGASSTSIANKIAALANQTGVTHNPNVALSSGMNTYVSIASTGGSVKVKTAIFRSSDSKMVSQSLESIAFTSDQAGLWVGTLIGGAMSPDLFDLAVWGNNPSAPEFASIFYDTLTNAGKNQSQTYGVWPNPLSGASTDNNRYSIYYLYTIPTNVIRVNSQDASATSSSASVTAIYPSVPTPGSLLIAAVSSNRPTGTNAISGWTLIDDVAAGASSVSLFAKLAVTGESASVQATAAGGAAMWIFIAEYSGAFLATGTTVPLVTEASGVTSIAAAVTSPTATINAGATNDLIIAVLGLGGGTGSAFSWDSSFTILYPLAGSTRLSVAQNIVSNSTTNSYSTTASWTTSRPSGTIIAAFKVAPAKPMSALGAG